MALLGPELFSLRLPARGVGMALIAQVLGALGRFEVGGMCAGALDHLGQALGVFQHRAGAQQVIVEGLAPAVLQEERLAQAIQKALFADVRAGVVDEDAGLDVARGVDVAVELNMVISAISPSFWKSMAKISLPPVRPRISRTRSFI